MLSVNASQLVRGGINTADNGVTSEGTKCRRASREMACSCMSNRKGQTLEGVGRVPREPKMRVQKPGRMRT